MKLRQANDIFISYLKKEKHRITPERFEVLDAALEYAGHFSADALFIALKNNKSKVSRATVYNTLELLEKCNLLRGRNFSRSTKQYESNLKKQNHDHLICVDCGKIVEFMNPSIDKIQKQICKDLGFEAPASYSFNIFTRCKNKNNCKHYGKTHT